MLQEDDFITEFREAREEVILRKQMTAERVAGEVARDDGNGATHAPAFVMRSARTLRASNICSANCRAARECAA